MFEEYDGVVYDLDGTIVRLAVDWQAARADVVDEYEAAGVPVDDGAGVWELLDRAGEHGIAEAVDETIARHEREGAASSRRLALADELAVLERPVAICSLNCEAACRIALETHGLADRVDAVVGRDSAPGRKPDPEPLLAAFDAVGVAPEGGLFVGDSESDELAAERAGTAFQYVRDRRDGQTGE